MSGDGADPGDRSADLAAGPPPLGLAITAAAAASTCIFLAGGPYVAFFAFVLAWLHAGLLGLPLYLALSRTRPLTEGASIAGGCAVGALPVFLVTIVLALSGGALPDGDDWTSAFLTACLFGFFGMFGGAAFWAVMRRHAAPRGFGPPGPRL